jgi:hypothetical protein
MHDAGGILAAQDGKKEWNTATAFASQINNLK